MASQNKTKPTAVSVDDFLAAVTPEARRADAFALRDMMQRLSGEPAVMWGPTIVGFGTYHYRYESGREGDMVRLGFSPRKPAFVLYIHDGFPEYETLRGRLGKITHGVGCIYAKRLSDLDLPVLEELMAKSLAHMRQAYPTDA